MILRVTELKTTDIKVGTGTEAVETSTVKVEYTGALTKMGQSLILLISVVVSLQNLLLSGWCLDLDKVLWV